MKSWITVLAATLAALAAPAVIPVSAAAAPTTANLRVEAAGKALDGGTSYVNDTVRLRTEPTQCSGKGRRYTIEGPTAMGIVQHARLANARLRPYFISDRFDFGLIVCRIGDFGAFSTSQAWLYKVNHVAPSVGGDQRRLARGDRVLWYFADFATGRNTGDELELRAPARVRPNEPFRVRALAYDFGGSVRAAGGAQVGGTTTGPDGRTTLTATRQGTLSLRVKRGNDIAGAPVRICVNARLDRCPPRRGELIVGTDRPDVIAGTRGADRVLARGAADRVDVAGGGPDVVDCGPGTDRVRLGDGDRAASSCEQVVRA
jgi:hypothetical protein